MRYRLASDALAWRRIEDQIVAVDKRTSSYLALNRSATALWPLLEAGADHDELIARLQTVYGIDDETAAAGVDALLTSLRDLELLVTEP